MKYYVFCFFKKMVIIGTQRLAGRERHEWENAPCSWLAAERRLYLLCQAKPAPPLTVRRCCDVFMLATCDASNGH